MIKFGSVCSGIEAASAAWHPLGWGAAWFSEIEPFPCAVLAHHYPDVPNHGDMTTLPERIRKGEVDAPDLFCGGTPCQAFSVAGLRRSLDDERGNLSLTFCEIANAIDDVRHSRGDAGCIAFWENVPGVLNTKDNAFGCFIAGLAGCDTPIVSSSGWTNAGMVDGPRRLVAWRVLDAQGFVPQRRRRVFVVAVEHSHRVDPRRVLFESQAEVVGSLGNRLYTGPLFPERTSLQRNLAPSREEGQGVAQNFSGCSASGGDMPEEVAHCLTTKAQQFDPTNETLVPTTYSTPAIGHVVEDDAASCITKNTGAGGETQNPAFVVQPVSYGIRTANTSSNGWGVQEEVTHTLDTAQGIAVAQPIGFDAYNNAVTGDVAKTLDVGQDHHHVPNVFEPVVAPSLTASNNPSRSPQSSEVTQQVWAVMQATQAAAFQQTADCLTAAYGTKWNGNASADNGSLFAMQATQAAIGLDEEQNARIEGFGTLKARMEGGGFEGSVMTPAMQVRRLTPVECERLQGFPDNYTAIPWRKKPINECPDGPRYKALGNSWAVPVVRWIGKRIQEQVR